MNFPVHILRVDLAGTLPRDKDRLVQELEVALNMGERAFVPKIFRGF